MPLPSQPVQDKIRLMARNHDLSDESNLSSAPPLPLPVNPRVAFRRHTTELEEVQTRTQSNDHSSIWVAHRLHVGRSTPLVLLASSVLASTLLNSVSVC